VEILVFQVLKYIYFFYTIGFAERLEKELAQLTPYKVKVHANANRAFSSSLGASALASTASYQNLFMTLEEYNEIGPKIVNRKCVF
jgi:actin-related protein